MRIKKFDRIEPDERKALLIKSAIRSLINEGYAGLSVRKIAKEANVSQGLVNHHFGSIYSLITCAYREMSDDFLRSISGYLEISNNSASEQLDAFFCCSFSEQLFEQDLLKPWLVFWSLVSDSEDMANAYEAVNGGIEEILNHLLIEINHEKGLENTDIALATQGLMALLDGLWVRLCLAPEDLSLESALKICRNWAKGYQAGLYTVE
ncbi:TetR family transcriptional regulator C-terminal domain-containing protein [Psychromonas sp. PT13]|uniref:TetR family transcriptional regulator C-terminal domain-containing protein n=1 Tax=Psychromonas sp. PT13 TaxID=3439547 RepID=UPI003EBFAB17